MIKSRRLLIYASCALLWCSTANDLAAQNLTQTEKQFTLSKTDVPIEGEYIDAVFHADSSTQELRPKIIIRNESVDFMTREGALQHRVVTRAGRYAMIAVNGKFIGFYHPDRFVVYKDTGELLWQDAPPEEGSEDVPERGYRISSQGNVCILLRHNGKIVFHDQHGAVLAEYVIADGMSQTLDGEWSSDGQYFLAYAGMRITQLHLFDARGAKLWDKRLEQKWVLEVSFSPKSQWLFVHYRDFSDRINRSMILSTNNAEVLADNLDFWSPKFTSDDKHLVAIATPRLVFFDLTSARKLFEVDLVKRIRGVHLPENEKIIYVLHYKKISSKKTSPSEFASFDIEVSALNFDGTVLNKQALGQIKAEEPRSLKIHAASTSRELYVSTDRGLIHFNVE